MQNYTLLKCGAFSNYSFKNMKALVTCADIRKIKKQLNWAPKISIKEGIEHLLTNRNF
jgi:nucleoside-diphosphate-sugar epimerase|tara:strand:- start:967 stop:1140 length:174 start_codon:yes stop_codon:yes gene_type:complete